MDKQGWRSKSWSPPNWKTNALRHQDMVLNDEDASGSISRDKQMEAASRLGGLMPEPFVTERNRFRPRDRNATSSSVKLESTYAEPQTYLERKEEYLHGSGWKDPICSLFHNGGGRQDSISTLFQTKDLATCQVEIPDAGGSFTVATPFKDSDTSSRMVDLKQNVTGPLTPISAHYQEILFQDTGFPPALIQRAILLHGAQADDSIILPFLLDLRDNNDVLGANCQKHFKHSESLLPNIKNTKITEENDSGLLTIRQQIANSMKRNGAEQLWEDVDSSDSDFDDDDEESPRKPGSDYPVSLCERKLPTGEGCRHLMSNYGFSAELVVRAIQELGEGVDYDMLLEYLLYIAAQQDPKASTSASCVKQACTAKKLVNECGYPTKQQASSKRRKSTVDILVEECGYPAKAVERALVICGTPLWNPEQVQMADLVDFLAAHWAGLNKSVDKAYSDEDSQGDASGSWLRQHREETVSTSVGGKRKLGYGSVARGKSIVCLNRPSSFKQEQYGHAPHSRTPILKQENFKQPPLNMNRSRSRMAKVKLAPSQQRCTPVGRIGRSRVVKEEVSIILDRHEGSVGFGLPGNPVESRFLDEDLKGAPFFYFENVASMPDDEWDRIRRHLFDIEPEFVDSLHFSACRRPRGYIHNLPIEGRRKILADPPMTIQELLPHTKAFWPAWDPRTKLNCITTRMGSEFLIKKLHIGEGTALQTADPSPEQQREILHLCRYWNLVWTAPNIPTPINEIEIEAMLGFDAGHSRNILSNRSRYKALGNSFSVYTVAFHFSVLKPLYPKGVKVLSLFSGIGGAEVALHKMGVKLLVVVSVEIDDGTRRCLEAWWASSKQKGVLNQNYRNIKDLGRAQISELVNMYGGFDLIVGGTPCNNLSGSNHVTRVGLDGKQSTIFFEFSRVVAAVRELTIRLQHK